MPTMYLIRLREITVLYCKILTRYKSKGFEYRSEESTKCDGWMSLIVYKKVGVGIKFVSVYEGGSVGSLVHYYKVLTNIIISYREQKNMVTRGIMIMHLS